MSFGKFARQVRNPYLPLTNKRSAFGSCMVSLSNLMKCNGSKTRRKYRQQYNLSDPSEADLLLAIAELERERNLYLEKLRRYERKRIRQKAKGMRQPKKVDTFWMLRDNDEWLLEVGDYIIKRKQILGTNGLNNHENATYYFWVIDYSIRNSGSLHEALEMCPQSISELVGYAHTNNLEQMKYLFNKTDVDGFPTMYYEQFDGCCDELRNLFDAP